MNNTEWREIAANPEEWVKAIALEKEINEMDPQGKGLFLHKSRVPLEVANLGEEGDEYPLFRDCQEAGCYT